MKLRLQLKIPLTEINFVCKVAMNQQNEDKTFSQVFLLIHDPFLPSTIWLFQFLSHYLFLVEARNTFI